MDERIEKFLASPDFGVVGASRRRQKFGNMVLRAYMQKHLKVTPVHPADEQIEGLDCVPSVKDLPAAVASISVITPPAITEEVVKHAVEKGILNIWMQPGAESEAAVRYCESHGVNLVYGGRCLLVELGFEDH